jgi:phosphoglycolate phosphatase-like HAD superfamily hydrolase
MKNVEQSVAAAPTDLRVLLWDIDGTLLRSTRRGAFTDYTVPALESIFGTAGRIHDMRVSGMTDLQIICEALRDEGITTEHIRERVGEIRTRFMLEMERVAATAATDAQPLYELLVGAREILERVALHPRYLSALLTGNLEPAAHLKLRLVGLTEFFTQLRRAHQRTAQTESAPRAIHRHRRHAERHRLRQTLRRALRRRLHGAFRQSRIARRAQPRRNSQRPLRHRTRPPNFRSVVKGGR